MVMFTYLLLLHIYKFLYLFSLDSDSYTALSISPQVQIKAGEDGRQCGQHYESLSLFRLCFQTNLHCVFHIINPSSLVLQISVSKKLLYLMYPGYYELIEPAI